jgi:pyruvate kinase
MKQTTSTKPTTVKVAKEKEYALRKKLIKIVATLGPATTEVPILEKAIKAGLNVARFNMSHGDHKEHGQKMDNFRLAGNNLSKRVGILVDLAGPKIRVGEMQEGGVQLKNGATIIVTTDKVIGTTEIITINYPKLYSEVKAGRTIMIEDGKKELLVVKKVAKGLQCKIITGGQLFSRKGVNLPGAYLSIPALTEKDKKDVEFAVKQKADFISLSFVRTPKDIVELKTLLKKLKSTALVIAKVETLEATEDLESIVAIADGIMVARGDLAVEVGPEKVPMIQKELITLCQEYGKPVITATQMLDSMEKSPVPTRAEVADIANAVLDGTDAIMLSGESATGDFPIEAISMMSKVALEVEPEVEQIDFFATTPDEALLEAAIGIAGNIGAESIVVVSESPEFAQKLSSVRAFGRIIAMAYNEATLNQLVLSRGVTSCLLSSTKEDMTLVIRSFLTNKYGLKKGSKVVVLRPSQNKTMATDYILYIETV